MGKEHAISVDSMTKDDYVALMWEREYRESSNPKKRKDWYWEEIVENAGTDKERVVAVRKVYNADHVDPRKLSTIATERQRGKAQELDEMLSKRLREEIQDCMKTNKERYETLPSVMEELEEEGKDKAILIQGVQWIRMKDTEKWESSLKKCIAKLEYEKISAQKQYESKLKKENEFREKQDEWKREAMQYQEDVDSGRKPRLDMLAMAKFAQGLVKKGYTGDFPMAEWEKSQ